MSDKNRAIDQLDSLKRKESEAFANDQIKKEQIFRKQNELEQSLALERKQLKQLTSKKDFEIRQL